MSTENNNNREQQQQQRKLLNRTEDQDVEQKLPATGSMTSEAPLTVREEPRPLLDPTQREEIRNYIEAYKAEIVDSSSVEIDEAEVLKMKERYQQLAKEQGHNPLPIDANTPGFTAKEASEEVGAVDWQADGFAADVDDKDVEDLLAQGKHKIVIERYQQQEQEMQGGSAGTGQEPVRVLVNARRLSPPRSRSKKSNASGRIRPKEPLKNIIEEKTPGTKSSKMSKERVSHRSPISDARQSVARSSDSGRLLNSLPKKRSVQQMIRDHQKQQEKEKQRKLSQDQDKAKQQTVLLRNRSQANRSIQEPIKHKMNRDRLSQKLNTTSKDTHSLPKLTEARRVKTGLPLPTQKHKTLNMKSQTSAGSERVSPNQSQRPALGNKQRLTILKKSNTLSKSLKNIKPLEIINEATKTNDQSLLKVRIPKPRPPQLPALPQQQKSKKIKIIALKKKPKQLQIKQSKSVSVPRKETKNIFVGLLDYPDSIRCKTCSRHDRNFRALSPQEKQEKLKTYNSDKLRRHLSNSKIELTNQRPPFRAEHFEEATELLQMSMMDQNKKIRDMHLKNEELSIKVNKMQRKLSQSLTNSKILVDETIDRPNQLTLCQTAATSSIIDNNQKSRARRGSRKQQQEQQLKIQQHGSQLTNNIHSSENKLKMLEKEYVSYLKKIKKYHKNPNIEDKLLRDIQTLDQQIAAEKLKQIENEKNQKQIDRIQNRAISMRLAGAHTEMAAQAEKTQSMGQQYKRLLQEYQIIQDKINNCKNFQKETKVQKMVSNEERIRQAEKVLQFYKEQAKTIDREIHQFIIKSSAHNTITDGSVMKQAQSGINFTRDQIQIKEAEQLNEQIQKVQRDIRAIQKSQLSYKQVNEATLLKNERQIIQLEQLIHELKSRVIVRCDQMKKQQIGINEIIKTRDSVPRISKIQQPDSQHFPIVSSSPSMPMGSINRPQNQLILDHNPQIEGSRIGEVLLPEVQSNSMASLLREFDPAMQHETSEFNAILIQQALREQEGNEVEPDDYQSRFSLPTGYVPQELDHLARPTEIVERLVINPDSSSNVDFQNSITHVQDGSEARMEVPAVISDTQQVTPSVGAASLPAQPLTTILPRDSVPNRLDLTEDNQIVMLADQNQAHQNQEQVIDDDKEEIQENIVNVDAELPRTIPNQQGTDFEIKQPLIQTQNVQSNIDYTKPKLSGRMKNKSQHWRGKRNASLGEINRDINNDGGDPSQQTAPTSKMKALAKNKNPYLSQFENAMRVFNFKQEEGQENGQDAVMPSREMKMTRQDIEDLRENIMNIDPLSSSKTKSIIVNSNTQKNSIVDSKTSQLQIIESSEPAAAAIQESQVDRSDLLRPPDSIYSGVQQQIEEQKGIEKEENAPFNNKKFTESAVKDVLQKIGLAQQTVEQACQRQMDKTPGGGGEVLTDMGQADQQSREMLFEEDQSSTYSLVNEADLRSTSGLSNLPRHPGKVGAATVERPRLASNTFEDYRSSDKQANRSAVRTVRKNRDRELKVNQANRDDAVQQDQQVDGQSYSSSSYEM